MKDYRVLPGTTVRLGDLDPGDTGGVKRAEAEARTAALAERLGELQEGLYAEGRRALLAVFQAMDAGGKDGAIKRAFSGVNPQGCRVASFKVPTPPELARDFLWRVHQEVPPKGVIGVFNRSHYEDVLVTRVRGLVSDDLAEQRFAQINDFERLLTQTGTSVVKFFLHISKDEQRERLQARVDDPEKRWKFNPGDLEERERWADYERAFEAALSATSTEHAPWYVVPADRKWYRDLVVAEVLVAALERMGLTYPPGPQGVDFDAVRIE